LLQVLLKHSVTYLVLAHSVILHDSLLEAIQRSTTEAQLSCMVPMKQSYSLELLLVKEVPDYGDTAAMTFQ